MLEVENISVRYGQRNAVRKLSLKVAVGEIVTLVGANGAGKTTTLKAISGILPLNEGTVRFEGQNLNGIEPHRVVEAGIAHVPEGRMMFADMTAYEHLELGALRAPSNGRTFAQALDWVYGIFPILKERHDQKAGTMSGGQQQMLAIARGLMAQPKLLMLDEPSLGLAPIMVDQLADAIRSVHANGMSILLVEQRIDMALRLADRGYVLEQGQVVIEDTANNLLNDPKVQAAYLGT